MWMFFFTMYLSVSLFLPSSLHLLLFTCLGFHPRMHKKMIQSTGCMSHQHCRTFPSSHKHACLLTIVFTKRAIHSLCLGVWISFQRAACPIDMALPFLGRRFHHQNNLTKWQPRERMLFLFSLCISLERLARPVDVARWSFRFSLWIYFPRLDVTESFLG